MVVRIADKTWGLQDASPHILPHPTTHPHIHPRAPFLPLKDDENKSAAYCIPPNDTYLILMPVGAKKRGWFSYTIYDIQ